MLKVDHGLIVGPITPGGQAFPNLTGEACWVVLVVGNDGRSGAIPLEFVREVDARRAMESLEEMGLWEGTLDEINDRIDDHTIDELKTKMTENLFW